MQNTSADYKLEINKPSRLFECKVTIGNNIYTNEDIVDIILDYPQPSDGFTIGNTISQTLDLTLINRGDIIYSTSQVKVEIGLKIEDRIEYIPMGIFNIDDIEKTDYTTKFTCYDNMIKFETAYFSELSDKPTLQQVVNELVKITGIQFEGSLPAYTVSKLGGFSCREILSYVASICGGNALITRSGKFTIKGLNEVAKTINGDNYFDFKREEVKYKVGKISCQVDENNVLSKGSLGTDSMELSFENPWITEKILTEIYNKLNGLSYLGYFMKWQGDLSLDTYDIITVTDIKNVTRKMPILSQKFAYTGGLTSEIGAKGESKNKNSFSSSGSTANKINRLITEQAVIKEALIDKANIRDLEAVSIKTQILEAKTAKIEEAIIGVAHISDLNAINANIEKLIAADVTINNALIGKADITELNAVQGNINSLNSQVANIQTLVNGNLTSDNIHSLILTSSKVTVENGFIKNAMIENVDVSKLNAGTISTDKFLIRSNDGGIEIRGATQQFKDKNNKVRLQLGKDSQGNFNFILRGEDGTSVLLDHTGLKAKAIADGLIVNDMLGQGAVTGDKVNIGSLIQEVNKDTNTSTIKATKIQLDKEGQSLDIAFNTLKTNVNNIQVGGRNLMQNTSDFVNTKFWSNNASAGTGIVPIIEDSCIKGKRSIKHEFAILEADTEYICIATIKSDVPNLSPSAQTPIHLHVMCNENTAHTNYVNAKCEYYEGDVYAPNKFTTYKLTFKTKPNITNIRFRFMVYHSQLNNSENANQNTIWLKRVKLEKGNKATDYTKAPEDLESRIESNTTQIAAQQGKIEALISDTSIVEDGSTKKLKDAYANLKLTVNGLNSTIGSHSTNITNLQGQMSTANSNISNLSGKVQTVESKQVSFEQNLSGISQKVSSAESNITTLKGQMTTANNNITSTNNKLDNLEIGGVNLLVQKNVTKGKFLDRTGGTTNNAEWFYTDYIPVSGMKKLIVSGFSNLGTNPSTCYYDSNKNFVKGINNNGQSLGKNITIDSNIAFIRFSGMIRDLSTIKIEKGTKATSYSKSPQDTEEDIKTIDGKLTTTNNKVVSIETNLSGISSKVSTVEATTAELEKITEKMLINNFSRSGTKDRWTSNIGTITSSDAVGYYANVSTNGDTQVVSNKFEIDSTKTYKISLMVQNPSEDGTGSWYFGVYAYDKNKNNIGVYIGTSSSLNTNPYFHVEKKAKKNTSWRTFESYIYGHNVAVDNNSPKGNCSNFFKFHAKTKYLAIRFLNYRTAPDYGTGTIGSIYFAHPTISEVDSKITNTEARLKSAESKITSDAIINTVSNTINIAKQEAINAANSNTANQLKNYATTSSVTQTVNSWVAKFSSSGGANLLLNGGFKRTDRYGWFDIEHSAGGTNKAREVWTNRSYAPSGKNVLVLRATNTTGEFGVQQNVKVKANTKYTLSFYVSQHRCPRVGFVVRNSNSTWLTSGNYNDIPMATGDETGNGYVKKSVIFNSGANTTVGIELCIYDSDDNGHAWFYDVMLNEGEVALPWSPHHSECYEGSTQIDASGATIKNGALRVQNNSGQTVLTGDSNGDLTLTGSVINGSNGFVTYLDRGGLVLETTGEKVGYIRSSSFASDRYINGLSIGTLGKGDYVDIGYTTDNELGSGTSLTPSIRIAKTDHSLLGSFNGVQLKAHTRVDYGKLLKFQNNTSYTSDVYANNSGKLCIMGDNGLLLGYKEGDSYTTSINIDESTKNIDFYGNMRDVKNGYAYNVMTRLNHGSVEKFAPRITNMNAYLDSGWYSFGTDCAGTPTGWGIMLTFRAFSTDMCQIVHGTNNVLYIRWYVNNNYTPWKVW